jgi:hypothetical protein
MLLFRSNCNILKRDNVELYSVGLQNYGTATANKVKVPSNRSEGPEGVEV